MEGSKKINFKKYSLLKGDASFRKFYRKKNKILVYCKKEKKTNLLNYDAINKILIKNKIKAPKLITNNYKNNFIEIEDFGDISFELGALVETSGNFGSNQVASILGLGMFY